MAVYITGDCHSDFRKLNTTSFPEQKNMTREDTVIICGDFGGVWVKDEKVRGKHGWKDEINTLNWLESKSFTTVFVDGNHENFQRLYEFPEKEWNGGKVHEIRPHVLHLMRGQVFTIEGEKYFTFGGASSHDIGHGIIDPETDENWKVKVSRFQKDGIWDYRVKGLEWWPEESFRFMRPEEVQAQKDEAFRNLEKAGWQVRYIISHELPSSVLALYSHGANKPDEHTAFLEEIRWRTDYKRWFAGHYHEDRQITMQDAVLYEQIIRIW